MRDRKFADIDPKEYAGRTVILDVDGTLVADGLTDLEEAEKRVLAELAQASRVYLCSNARSNERIRQFASSTGASYLDSPYKKPDPRVVRNVPEAERGKMVVIGDKYLTDGLLAHLLKVPFVKARRIRRRRERLLVHLAYAIDAVLGRVAFLVLRALPIV